MNSNHCSKLATLLVVLAVTAAMAVPVAAVSVSETDVPDEAEVGSELTATLELDDLYTDYNEWSLAGETELSNVTWTVTKYDQSGTQVEENAYDGQEFNQSIDIDDGTSSVDVRVTGTVPEVGNYTYEPAQTFVLADLSLARGDEGTTQSIETIEVHHYTEESAEARTAIENAEAAIADAEEAGADTGEAETALQNAIDAYHGENFGLAVELGNDAAAHADDARDSSEQRQLLIYGAAGLLVLLLLGGGGYVLYQRSQDEPDPLG